MNSTTQRRRNISAGRPDTPCDHGRGAALGGGGAPHHLVVRRPRGCGGGHAMFIQRHK